MKKVTSKTKIIIAGITAYRQLPSTEQPEGFCIWTSSEMQNPEAQKLRLGTVTAIYLYSGTVGIVRDRLTSWGGAKIVRVRLLEDLLAKLAGKLEPRDIQRVKYLFTPSSVQLVAPSTEAGERMARRQTPRSYFT